MISRDTALFLLSKHHYDTCAVVDRYLGVKGGPGGASPIAAAPAADDAGLHHCAVCMSDLPLAEFLSCTGGDMVHNFCVICWRAGVDAHVKSVKNGGAGIDVPCLEISCYGVLQDGVAQACVAQEVAERHRRARREDYALKIGMFRSCAYAGCPAPSLISAGAAGAAGAAGDVACAAGHVFCAGCRMHGGHAPATCANTNTNTNTKYTCDTGRTGGRVDAHAGPGGRGRATGGGGARGSGCRSRGRGGGGATGAGGSRR